MATQQTHIIVLQPGQSIVLPSNLNITGVVSEGNAQIESTCSGYLPEVEPKECYYADISYSSENAEAFNEPVITDVKIGGTNFNFPLGDLPVKTSVLPGQFSIDDFYDVFHSIVPVGLIKFIGQRVSSDVNNRVIRRLFFMVPPSLASSVVIRIEDDQNDPNLGPLHYYQFLVASEECNPNIIPSQV